MPDDEIMELVDRLIEQREVPPPRWAMQRLKRLLGQIADEGQRERVVDGACVRAPSLAVDIRRAANEQVIRPTPRNTVNTTHAPRSRQQFGRELRRVPDNTRVTYQGSGAVIRRSKIALDDGTPFDTPTPAAEHVNGGTPVNGWDVWKVSDGRSLGECYDSSDWPI